MGGGIVTRCRDGRGNGGKRNVRGGEVLEGGGGSYGGGQAGEGRCEEARGRVPGQRHRCDGGGMKKG